MNVHDSERLPGCWRTPATRAPGDGDTADVVVFNTCAVRENADNRLYGNLGQLKPVKDAHAGHADRRRRVPGAEGPRRDRAAGAVGRRRVRHAQHRLAAGAARAGPDRTTRRRSRSSSRCETFPSTLPTRRESPYAAWVAISVGCNNTCTFCIVPALRGKEKDRRPGDVLAEVRGAGRRGRPRGHPARAERQRLRRRVRRPRRVRRSCCAPAGRSRGWSGCGSPRPHPRDFTDDVIAAMAETPNVMPSLHMPLQSGSDRVLAAMRRSLPLGSLPRHHRPGARRDAGGSDHHRHHRGLPRRDRGGLRSRRSTSSARPGSPRRSRSSTPSDRAPRPRRWPTRFPRTSSRSATSGSSALRRARSPGRRTSARSAVPWSCWSPRARAARTARPTGCPAARPDNRLVHFTTGRQRPSPRRHGDRRGHLRRPAPPRVGHRPCRRAPDPRR